MWCFSTCGTTTHSLRKLAHLAVLERTPFAAVWRSLHCETVVRQKLVWYLFLLSGSKGTDIFLDRRLAFHGQKWKWNGAQTNIFEQHVLWNYWVKLAFALPDQLLCVNFNFLSYVRFIALPSASTSHKLLNSSEVFLVMWCTVLKKLVFYCSQWPNLPKLLMSGFVCWLQ